MPALAAAASSSALALVSSAASPASYKALLAAAPPSTLFVLLSTLSYFLPVYEAWRRRSPFYLFLFLALLALSFAVHCEDMSVCAPLPDATLARLHGLSQGVTYYLLTCMELVVFEVRDEQFARVVCGAWATLVWLIDPSAVAVNVVCSLALTAALLAFELRRSSRRINWPTYFRRLGVIAFMAACGFLIFRLLHSYWLWHGVWHAYTACTCFLLLLAQRSKLEKRIAGKARDGGASGSRNSADGGASVSGVTTPFKRGGTAGGASGAGSGEASGAPTEEGTGATAPLLRGSPVPGAAVGGGPAPAGGGGGGGGASWPAVQPV